MNLKTEYKNVFDIQVSKSQMAQNLLGLFKTADLSRKISLLWFVSFECDKNYDGN